MLQRYGRFAKGELCPIAGTKERGLVLIKDGRRSTMSYQYANRVAVAAEKEIEVAPGDRLQLKFNGKSKEGHSIANGELVTVRRINADGSLKVEDDRLKVNSRRFRRSNGCSTGAMRSRRMPRRSKTVDTGAGGGCGLPWRQRIKTNGMSTCPPSMAGVSGRLFSRTTRRSFAPASSKAASANSPST